MSSSSLSGVSERRMIIPVTNQWSAGSSTLFGY